MRNVVNPVKPLRVRLLLRHRRPLEVTCGDVTSVLWASGAVPDAWLTHVDVFHHPQRGLVLILGQIRAIVQEGLQQGYLRTANRRKCCITVSVRQLNLTGCCIAVKPRELRAAESEKLVFPDRPPAVNPY